MTPRDPGDHADDHRTSDRAAAVPADGGFDDAFFRTVVERIGVGVAVYDESGTIQYANEALADVLGLDHSAVVGTALWEIDPAIEADEFGEYWQRLDVGETRSHQAHYASVGDDPVPVDVTTTAVDAAAGRYHVATITDASERVADWAEMERQDERLSEIASVISHDLRNPLNVAMGRAELAAMDAEDPEHLEYVERSLEKMEALITDVLTMARKGSRLTDAEPTALEDAVNTAWYETDGREEASLTVADDLGRVESAEGRLPALFAELFENAIDHAGPAVTITVGRLDDGFYVADDGPGVPESDREEAFDYGFSTETHGTGFGLTIVEHVAAAHGWSVQLVESDDGGARIEVRDVDFCE